MAKIIKEQQEGKKGGGVNSTFYEEVPSSRTKNQKGLSILSGGNHSLACIPRVICWEQRVKHFSDNRAFNALVSHCFFN